MLIARSSSLPAVLLSKTSPPLQFLSAQTQVLKSQVLKMSTTAQQPEKGKISLNWADKATGQFRRHDSSFRDTVSSSLPDSKHFAEPGRYHLYICECLNEFLTFRYVSHACPWGI